MNTASHRDSGMAGSSGWTLSLSALKHVSVQSLDLRLCPECEAALNTSTFANFLRQFQKGRGKLMTQN